MSYNSKLILDIFFPRSMQYYRTLGRIPSQNHILIFSGLKCAPKCPSCYYTSAASNASSLPFAKPIATAFWAEGEVRPNLNPPYRCVAYQRSPITNIPTRVPTPSIHHSTTTPSFLPTSLAAHNQRRGIKNQRERFETVYTSKQKHPYQL